MKESLIKSLRQQGKSWKEVSKEVGGHPNYLSNKFGKKAKKAMPNKPTSPAESILLGYREACEQKEKTAKDLISAMRLIQDLGGTVIF